MVPVMTQLYKFDNAETEVETINGKIKYIDWLMKEKERILKYSGRKAEVRKNRIKQFALFVDEKGVHIYT